MAEITYNCPHCSDASTVDDSLAGQNLVCPHCSQEFFATPPEQPFNPQPETLPFFKFSRRKLLKNQLQRLTADGEYSEADHQALETAASRLGLKDEEITKLRLKELEEASEPLKGRIYQTAHVTDEDLAELADLGRRFHITIEQEPMLKLCRDIFLMEVKGENPLVALDSGKLMLDRGEALYFSVRSRWGQLRSKTVGYSGLTVSLPTGLRGVRFRLGQLTPTRSESLTILADGVLHITSKRILFNGDRRNTTITLGRIVGTSLFSDAVEIEKSAGRSDYFFMNALLGRYVSAVIGFLKAKSL